MGWSEGVSLLKRPENLMLRRDLQSRASFKKLSQYAPCRRLRQGRDRGKNTQASPLLDL